MLANNGVQEENIEKVIEELISPNGVLRLSGHPEYSPRLEYILGEERQRHYDFARKRLERSTYCLRFLGT